MSPSPPTPDSSGPQRPPTNKLFHNVTELRRRLGQRVDVDIDVMLEPLEVIASRSTPHPVLGSAVIESIERGVTVTGAIRFGWEGECRRCLDPVAGEVEADVFEIFQVGAPEDEDDIRELEDDTVDFVPIVRDVVLLSLPLAPLCRSDCPGPDPDRYPAKTAEQLAEEAANAEPTADPRWAALEGLTFDD